MTKETVPVHALQYGGHQPHVGFGNQELSLDVSNLSSRGWLVAVELSTDLEQPASPDVPGPEPPKFYLGRASGPGDGHMAKIVHLLPEAPTGLRKQGRPQNSHD